MEPKYVYSESTEKPITLEVGHENVYLRKDIKEDHRQDSMSGDDIVYWTYYEAVMSNDEFNQYANKVAMENAIKGADNAENIVQILKEQNSGGINQITIMEAIADLFDVIASSAL